MKKVVLRAPCLTQSGYGVHSRQVARWLINLADQDKIKLSIQCVPWGDTSWFLNPELCDGLIGKIMKYSVGDSSRSADVSFQLILPNEWDPNIATYNVGLTAGVETTRCNPAWIQAVNQMDEVIVPSTHIENTFRGSGFLHKKITVIPEAFPDALLEESNIDTNTFEFETDFNLLVFGQLTAGDPALDRKNIYKTLQSIIETFRGKEDVGIILKSNLGKNTILDYKALQGIITSVMDSLNHDGTPKVYLLHGTLSNEEVRDLYYHPTVKALVTLTRGEGFGLPVLEAAACGVPVVATNWSSYKDFMKGDAFDLKVKYDLEPISPKRVDNAIFVPGAKWAEAKLESSRENLERLYRYPAIYRRRAEDHKKFIIENYSFKTIEKTYNNHFEKVLS
jgi:glycosyltransferase involved in cell wall biosynthesis